MRKSLLVTVFTLFFSFDASTANERQPLSNEDTAIVDNFDRILQEKDYEAARPSYPQLLEALYKYSKENEIAREVDPSEVRWEVSQPAPRSTYEFSYPISRLVSDWLNREEMKRKRAHHRALCHFKICNMGSKRSGSWDVWPNNN